MTLDRARHLPMVCARCGRVGGSEVLGARIDRAEGRVPVAPVPMTDPTGGPYAVLGPTRYVVALRCRAAAGCRP